MRVDALAVVDEPLDRVGDLELLAGARPDRLDRLPDRVVEHVDADEGEVGLRLLRLFGQADDAAVLELRDAELRRVRNLREQDLRVAAEAPVVVHERRDPVGDDVVAEVHDEGLAAQERTPRSAPRARGPAGRPARCT